MKKTILGIETSCDDTSICILNGDPTNLSESPEILALSHFTQEEILAQWGGVVPEIAARNHLAKIAPLIKGSLKIANLELKDLDLLAVTTMPGLLGPLLTGINAAKTMALMYELPILPVNHLYAHVEAIHLDQKVSYPYLGIVVSGGHSLYLLVKSPLDFEVLGTTIDDAAGEAFDKGGKILGLGYPAGKIIDDLAKKGNENWVEFPIGLKGTKDANLSYSGLKTSLRQWVEKNGTPKDQELSDLCASYQSAIVCALKLKLKYAIKVAKEKTGRHELPIVVGGGVACNSKLREELKGAYQGVHFVTPKYCTDNGAMIANFALRTYEYNIPYPESLKIDAKSSVVEKKRVSH